MLPVATIIRIIIHHDNNQGYPFLQESNSVSRKYLFLRIEMENKASPFILISYIHKNVKQFFLEFGIPSLQKYLKILD